VEAAARPAASAGQVVEEGDRRRWRKRGWWGLSPSGAVALARETAAWVVAFGEKQASSSALLAALAC